ncbi:cystine ABC transporter ATP binding subunit [Hyphomicrobiales bacterium]|nr:cystine ABC transporter ATP binding subunit [Hyphomicrobiales bacterium]CAH1695640.1 cystine ABC transporter ATP binding subunit [Hyphomicrobiales bacterium]
MSALEVSGVSKRFGRLQVLQNIDLRLEKGQMLALIGRSGSGKSTLLRCMNGLERVDAGHITIGGHSLSYAPAALRRLRQDVGIVFQAYNLFPHLSVGRNIMLAPRLVLGWSSERAEARAREVLATVGLSEKFDAYPDQLSGGQQQRVAIARSLAMAPQVMLFDEVTSALDPELTGEVLLTMESLARSGMTMVLVTHEMNFARSVAHVVAFMHNGRIHEIAPAEDLFARPRTEELRRFLSSSL